MYLNSHNEENASNISLNRITPLDDDSPFGKLKKTKFKKKDISLAKRNDSNSEDSLKGYLSDFCKFKTQNIVSGIAELAKQ